MDKAGIVRNVFKVLALVLVLVLSIFVLSPYFSSRETYKDETEYMDEKLSNANKLALGSTSISYLVSLLPDDHGTPIANELAKVASYLLLVISAILLEKFLLTVIGYISFTLLFLSAAYGGSWRYLLPIRIQGSGSGKSPSSS